MKVNHHSIRRILISLFVCVLATTSTYAQEPSASVRQVVDHLFEGMKTADSTKLRSVFTKECSLTSISKNNADSVVVHKSAIGGFIKAVGTPHKEVWNEKIYDVKISMDGPLAIAWTPYKFYLGEKFSHCGVNVITLIQTKTGWKINDITDTRRKEACP